jgi:hypothetical protein
MRQMVYSVMLIFGLIISIFLLNKDSVAETKKYNENKIQYVVSVNGSPLMKEVHKNKVEDKVENKRYKIKDVNLDDSILDYIWNKANENDLSYTLILAMAKQESDLNKDKVNRNSNGTTDRGLLQINSRSLKWLGELADIKNPNPMNDYHNVNMAIAYLVEERDFWRTQGLSEEQVFFATVLTYNQGRGGATSYIRSHGWHSKYVENILKYKGEFEQNIM